MAKIYGTNDGLLIIENGNYKESKINCSCSDVVLAIDDGAIIRCGYGKQQKAVWRIEILRMGTAPFSLFLCNDETADPHSDIFETDAAVKNHWVIDKDAQTSLKAFNEVVSCLEEKDQYREGAEYIIYELMKELDIPGSNEVRKLPSADDMCAAAAKLIRQYLV